MNKAIETFTIPQDCRYVIDKDEKGFHVWCGGCGIGHGDTIDEARDIIFKHTTDTINRKIAALKEDLISCNTVLATLDNDKFNIARFKE